MDFAVILESGFRFSSLEQVLEDLIDDEDDPVFADSAYTSKSSDELLLKNDC